MNILFAVPYTPTPIRTRPYNLLRGLARRGHSVTLATLWENEQERQVLAELEAQGIQLIAARLTKARSLWNSLLVLFSGQPLQAAYCWQPALAQAIQGAIRNSPFAIAHVEHLRGANYGLWTNDLGLPTVWDSVDCISYLFEQAASHSRSAFGRWMTRLELPRTRRYEAWLVSQFDRVLVTSPLDKSALESLPTPAGRQSAICNLESAISILPNGVDLAYFTPTGEPREPATVVFTGKMSYHANVTAVLHLMRDIMPYVWAQRPDVKLYIVGKDPPREIANLQSAIGNRKSAIVVTGTVPDIRPYLRRTAVAVAPVTYGAGVQNKVLEAMACGTPVVATPQAVSALEARPDDHLLVEDGPEAFAQAVLHLLGDADLRARLGSAGRGYVEAHHDWRRVAEKLAGIYQQVIEEQERHGDTETR